MDKEKILLLAKEKDCSYEIGIWSEVNSFMEYNQELVERYDLVYAEHECRFDINIVMRDDQESNILSLFKKLIDFIGYENIYWVKENLNDSTQFYILSYMDNNKGFLFSIIFN